MTTWRAHSASLMSNVHASCVEIDGRGILLRGKSGAGKSDLALRLIDAGAVLVADDRVDLTVSDGELFASAPLVLQGLIEVRGLGLVRMPFQERTGLRLVIDLLAENVDQRPGRLPLKEFCRIENVALPLFTLKPFESSALSKVKLMLRAVMENLLVGDDD